MAAPIDRVGAKVGLAQTMAENSGEAHGGSSVLNGAGEPLPTPDAQDANESGDDDDDANESGDDDDEGYF